jgi:hypothetical protein
MKTASLLRRSGASFVLLLTCSLVGCGDGGVELLPVSGTVGNGDQPLTTGTLEFHPDAAKGSTGKLLPRAEIAEDGTYTLYTTGEDGAEKGAPAGWYKVTVFAEEPRPTEGAEAYAPAKLLVRDEYTSAEKTPLSVEVKPDAPADAYNISLEPRQ